MKSSIALLLFASVAALAGEPDASKLGLDPRALARLRQRAKESQSDALVVVKDRQVVVEEYFGKKPHPLELMSITKGIVSLAVGMLIDDGKIASVDAPLSTWFPDWKTGAKAKVTLRHLLTHTSGLRKSGDARGINGAKDRLAYARGLPVVDEPGKTWAYSNEGIELLAGVIRSAAGKPVDEYVKERLFAPLGIRDFHWDHDDAGNVITYAELQMLPRDLVRVAQMMIDGGRAPSGQQLVSRAWIEQSTAAGRGGGEQGLVWFVSHVGSELRQTAQRRALLRAGGFAAADKLAPLDGRPFPSIDAYAMEAQRLLTAGERDELFALMRTRRELRPFDAKPGTAIGFHHDGSLGQFLEVDPGVGLVVVRMNEPEGDLATDEAYAAEEEQHGMSDFYDLVHALVPRPQK